MTVKEFKTLIGDLPDDYEVEITARQRMSWEEQNSHGTVLPYHFLEGIELNFEDVSEEDRTLYLGAMVSSAFFFFDN